MRKFENLIYAGWICLIALLLIEQTIGIKPDPGFNTRDYRSDYASYGNQGGSCSSFILPAPLNTQTIQITDIRQTLFKWKPIKPEILLTPCSPTRTYPEFLQDISRCTTVAYVLYPYHEFL